MNFDVFFVDEGVVVVVEIVNFLVFFGLGDCGVFVWDMVIGGLYCVVGCLFDYGLGG